MAERDYRINKHIYIYDYPLFYLVSHQLGYSVAKCEVDKYWFTDQISLLSFKSGRDCFADMMKQLVWSICQPRLYIKACLCNHRFTTVLFSPKSCKKTPTVFQYYQIQVCIIVYYLLCLCVIQNEMFMVGSGQLVNNEHFRFQSIPYFHSYHELSGID